MKILFSICVCYSVTKSETSFADEYFDPGFLTVAGEESPVDLSIFSKEGGMEAGIYPVKIIVNQNDMGDSTVNFVKNNEGSVIPELTPELLDAIGVNVDNIPSMKMLAPNSPIENLSALIPEASVKFDLSKLSIFISIPQIAMKRDIKNMVDPSLLDEGIPAFLTNYTLSAGQFRNKNNGASKKRNSFFSLFHSGINAGSWRLRSTMSQSYSSDNSGSDKSSWHTNFYNTYLSRDFVNIKSTLLLGESNTGNDVFNSVQFRGVKLSYNDQMLPSQLRGYTPIIDGFADSNARVVVRQNNNIVYETWVAPGPFRLDNMQQAGLSGDYDVTVTESNGTVRSFTVPYSSLPVMLRPGGVNYELTGGRTHDNFGKETNFVLGTMAYGLNKTITLYGGSLLANDYQSFSIGNGISLGSVGAISLDVTSSSAKLPTEIEKKTGESYRIRYSKSLLSTGTSIDLTALRYSTRGYYTFNEFNSSENNSYDNEYYYLSSQQRTRSSFLTSISQQLDDYGNVSFRLSKDNYWGGQRSSTGLAFGYNSNYRGISYNINYNIDRIKDGGNNWPEDRRISANVSIPLRIFSYSPSLNSVYATTSVSHDNHGGTNIQSGISGSALNNKLSYSASQSFVNQNNTDNTNLNMGWQGEKGSISGGYNYNKNAQSLNVTASGGVVVHSGGVTLSRVMGNSIALVSAPNAPGVTTSSGTITDSYGYAVVPYLSSYEKNRVGLDPSTLPAGVDLQQTDINVYPTAGAVVKADFITRVGYQVLVTLTRSNNRDVPFGAVATVSGLNDDTQIASIVGDSGQVYLSGMPKNGTLQVAWGNNPDQQCKAIFNLHKMEVNAVSKIALITIPCS